VTTLRRRLIAGAALLACATPFGVAQAQDADDQLNRAVAVTEQDGSRAFDFQWQLDRQRGGVVAHQNIANAAARCTDCRATAIAFQIVLASRGSKVGTVQNQAVAINDQCTNCVVYAGARQFVRVIADANNAAFTDAGRATLSDVRNDLRALEDQNLDVDALTAVVEAQEARVLKVLTEEVVTTSGDEVSYHQQLNRQANAGG
jgi:putative peptide zinc metalloprotease protein